MKKLFLIGMIVVSMVALWGWKRTKSNMTVVLPEKTVFFIDQDLSKTFTNNLKSSISQFYAVSKNPAKVMEQATGQFLEISSMKVQICQSDKICFYIDAQAPVLLLNGEFVVCENGISVPKDHFASDVLQGLVTVARLYDGDLLAMVKFVQVLPQRFKEHFSIEWRADSDIVLQPKDSNGLVLQVGTQAIPVLQDLISCELIGAGLSKKLKSKKKRMVYDLRFKNQIIVR